MPRNQQGAACDLVNDPAADHADEQVSITRFTNAWQTGEESIVVTAAAG
jgi:hypothetical protein